jgi:hypothetical protein
MCGDDDAGDDDAGEAGDDDDDDDDAGDDDEEFDDGVFSPSADVNEEAVLDTDACIRSIRALASLRLP